MQFTFGIITNADAGPTENLVGTVCSIRELEIPECEIIIVGNEKNIRRHQYLEDKYPNLKVINFNESIRPGWITRKKNLITQAARYENIVYTHDYFRHNKDWFKGFQTFGNDWKVVVPKIQNWDGSRYRDWVLWIYPQITNALKSIGATDRQCLLPYGAVGLSRYQYISGAYWIAKKSVMEEFPLNESLMHEGGEDVEWSGRVSKKYDFSMNPHSSVAVVKTDRHRVFDELGEDKLIELKKILRIG